MIHEKRYTLVRAQARDNTNLKDYESIICRVAESTFEDALVDVDVGRSSFVLHINHPTEKIPRGKLINLGKRLASNLNEVCQSSMRIYPSKTHQTSRQLFRCRDTVLHNNE